LPCHCRCLCTLFGFRLMPGRTAPIINPMKITDDYNAKIELWARTGKVCRIPRIANLPSFGHRRFNSYAELRAWKQSLLDELARQGGARWTK
jgi:hypothetical protein